MLLPPGLHLSFQRYAAPPGGHAPERVPASLGLLPVGEADGELLLPLAEGEAFWIGLEAAWPVRLVLAVDGGRLALERLVAGADRIAGVEGLAFSRAGVGSLRLATDEAEATLRLVDYGEFTARTGRAAPAPLDPRAGYGGWRLP